MSVVYKICRAINDKRYSFNCWPDDVEDICGNKLTYHTTKKTYPLRGYLYAFSTLEGAMRYLRQFTYASVKTCEVWEAKASVSKKEAFIFEWYHSWEFLAKAWSTNCEYHIAAPRGTVFCHWMQLTKLKKTIQAISW
mgnify:CR=1 FL=1